jgi:hypothetical protein
MYVNKPQDYPSILNIAGADMTPKLLDYKKTVDHDGRVNEIIEALIYARIDSEIYKSFIGANISEGYKPESIEIRLANKSISSYRGKSGQTTVGQYLKSNSRKLGTRRRSNNSSARSASTVKRSDLNGIMAKVGSFKKNKTKDIFNDTILLGSISIASALMDVKRQEDSNKSKVYRVERSEKIPKQVIQLQNLVAGSFKKTYTSMIAADRDPVFLFQNPYGKISEGNRKGGRRSKIRSLMSEDDAKAFLPVYKNITSIIRGVSQGVRNLEIKKSYEERKYVKLSLKTRINLRKLEALGEEIHVLMLVKNKKGIKLNTDSYSFLLNDILRQKNIEGIEYDVKTSRLNSGSSLLAISNPSKDKKVSVDVQAKKIKRTLPFDLSNYLNYNSVELTPKQSVKLKDGKLDKKGFGRSNFKINENIFYRTTLNFKDKNYLNCKGIVDKSRRVKQENIPFCTITATIDPNNVATIINIKNISENVAKIRLKKYRYKNGVKGDLLKTIDRGGNENKFKEAKKGLDSITFSDFDIYRTKKYMYVAECIMKNGEKKIASSYFINEYEERTNAVQISDVNLSSSLTGVDGDESNLEVKNITRSVNIDFKINKIQTEIDKVLENMFGDLFEIFKQDLTEIKDVQGLVYSIQIDRINRDTGENETIGKVTADKEGNCSFVDNTCSALDDITYKLIPRVSPGVDLIDKINSTIDSLGQKTIFNTINYLGASNRRKLSKRSDNIYSSKNNKFTKRNAFLKGLIETPKFTINTENLDIFLNSQTGDIEYVNLNSESTFTPDKKISISNASIEEISNYSHSISTNNNLKERYYDITFETNSSLYYVDFFAFFIKENNSVYLDGSMHVSDTFLKTKKLSYLVKQEGSVGLIHYYAVPFFKDGVIGEPIPVISQTII